MSASMRTILSVGLMILCGLGMLGGGIFEIVVQRSGAPTTAQITDCMDLPGKYHSETCNGTWVTGGSLLTGGHVTIGTVDGATRDQIGKTIPVRVWGDRAYTTSLRVPIILIVFGLSLFGYGIYLARNAGRSRTGQPA